MVFIILNILKNQLFNKEGKMAASIKVKAVINKSNGSFCLSKEAYEFLGIKPEAYSYETFEIRNDPKLINCIETLGVKANGPGANLKVVEIWMPLVDIPKKHEYFPYECCC